MSEPNETGTSETMTTYRRADGELIMGDYGWMGSLDWIEDEDTFDVVEEVWVLQRRRTGTHYHRVEPCPTCHGDGETETGVACDTCAAGGGHPLAGELVWTNGSSDHEEKT